MRIAFIHDWEPDFQQIATWRDGLWASLIELQKRGHEVKYFSIAKNAIEFDNGGLDSWLTTDSNLGSAVKQYSPDVILHWADLTRPNAQCGRDLGLPQALCFAGGSTDGGTSAHFDKFFVESNVYLDRLSSRGYSVSTAFGTNTGLFNPLSSRLKNQCKTIDVLFPATHCNWKRHKLLAKAVKGTDLKVTTAGYMYDTHETECWTDMQEAGATVLPHVSAEALSHLYAASRCVVIPSRSDGGSQRTVLEAMAMNIPVIVMKDSDKTSEYVLDAMNKGFKVGAVVEEGGILAAIEEWKNVEANGRRYIMENWSEFVYADNLEAGLKSLL